MRALQRCNKSPTVEATLEMFRDSYNPHCPGGQDRKITRKYMFFCKFRCTGSSQVNLWRELDQEISFKAGTDTK